MLFGGGVFRTNNGTVHVQGSNGVDNVTINRSGTIDVQLNSATFHFGVDEVSAVRIRTHAGNDILTVAASLAKPIWAHGGEGTDTASIYDSAGNDTFTAYPTYSAMTYADGSKCEVSGFEQVYAYATAGGNDDVAYLYDSSGDGRVALSAAGGDSWVALNARSGQERCLDLSCFLSEGCDSSLRRED